MEARILFDVVKLTSIMVKNINELKCGDVYQVKWEDKEYKALLLMIGELNSNY